jgi:hypothetical protein
MRHGSCMLLGNLKEKLPPELMAEFGRFLSSAQLRGDADFEHPARSWLLLTCPMPLLKRSTCI